MFSPRKCCLLSKKPFETSEIFPYFLRHKIFFAATTPFLNFIHRCLLFKDQIDDSIVTTVPSVNLTHSRKKDKKVVATSRRTMKKDFGLTELKKCGGGMVLPVPVSVDRSVPLGQVS